MDASGIDPVTGYWRMRGVYNPTRQQILSTPRVIVDASGQEWAVAPGGSQHVRTGRRIGPGWMDSRNSKLVSKYGPDVEASDIIPPEPPRSSSVHDFISSLTWEKLAIAGLVGYIILRRS